MLWFGFRVFTQSAEPLYIRFYISLILLILFFVSTIVLLFALLRSNKRRLRHAEGYDFLTGLLTASVMEGAVNEFFRRHRHTNYCLVCMDIVAFHRFNTMYGHTAGDALLKTIGTTISSNYACVTHLSSDIFVFVAPNRYPLAEEVMEKIWDAVCRDMGEQYAQVLNYKFGVYPLLHDKLEFRAAYDGALMALKTAKGLTDQYEVVYDRKMQRQSETERNIEMNMQRALDGNEFLIYVQPKFRLADLACCGGEVLIRWQSEQMGFLMPGQFVGLFEQTGFVAEMDLFMMDGALCYLQSLMDAGDPLLPIAVNQSRITLSFPNYLQRLELLLAKYTVPRSYIEIEITESALHEDDGTMRQLMRALRKMGFTIAIDDFGTGYSSLNSLHTLPVDVLKLDKSFLSGESNTSSKGLLIVQGIINMANALNLSTVCEGIEAGTQLNFLRAAGCEIGQGFLLAKPIPLSEFHTRYVQKGPA